MAVVVVVGLGAAERHHLTWQQQIISVELP